MKLVRENLVKEQLGDTITYKYTCNNIDFFLVVKGGRSNRDISVFKGSLDNREDELKTDDSLAAWNYFEDLLKFEIP